MIPDLFWIPGPWRGHLAISSRPRGGDWLEDEVLGWGIAHVDSVVSLLEKTEEKQLELTEEGRLAEANGIRFFSFPIVDRGVPNSVRSTLSLLRSVNEALEQGQNVAIHCRQGIGRSALVAAGTLMAAGASAETALQTVRSARGLDVPETPEQLDWLKTDLAYSLETVPR
jgi:protein-tyrosine phosphatase